MAVATMHKPLLYSSGQIKYIKMAAREFIIIIPFVTVGRILYIIENTTSNTKMGIKAFRAYQNPSMLCSVNPANLPV